MKRINIGLFVFICLLCIQCDDQGTSQQSSMVDTTKTIATQVNPPSSATTNAAKEAQSTEDIEKEGQTMAVSSFNQTIQSAQGASEEWVNSPVLVALKFCGEDMDSRKKSIELESESGESFDKLMVVIKDDGFLDDSLQGTIKILRMAKTNGTWQITKATQAWNCWRGRGHQDYNTEPCS